MGKIPPIAIIIAAVVLVIGISAAAFYLLVQPEQVKLETARKELEAETAVANRLIPAQQQLDDVNERLAVATENMIKVRERKSIHISNYMPLLAMTALWYEYRKDLPAAVAAYAAETGCNIEVGTTIPSPPMAPPTVPASGFMQVPGNTPLNLTISGPLANIERFYRSLSRLPRVAILSGLDIAGSADRIHARVALSLFILVEGETAGGGAAPGAAPGAGPGGAGPGATPTAAPAPTPPADEEGDKGGDKPKKLGKPSKSEPSDSE